MFSRDVNDFLHIYFMCTLKEVFTNFKMKIPSEASTFMSEDRFDVRKGPNLKIHLLMHLKGPYFAEMINSYGISIY